MMGGMTLSGFEGIKSLKRVFNESNWCAKSNKDQTKCSFRIE